MDLFIVPLTLYFYTNTLRPLILSRCNQMAALTELKGQNGTHKQQRYVTVKRQPHKQQDGGYGCSQSYTVFKTMDLQHSI